LRYSIVFHSQINDQTKRQNQTLKQDLRSYINYQQNDWVTWLSFAEYVYNNNFNSIIEVTSFEVIYDEFARWEDTIQNMNENEVSTTRLRVEQAISMRKHLEKSWLAINEKQVKYYNLKHISKRYDVEAMMYLCVKNIKSTRLFKKLNYKYYDSYEIEKLINKQAYKLILLKNMRKIHNVFHVSLLESYKENLEDAKSSLLIVIKNED
jgi:hypothetical protein